MGLVHGILSIGKNSVNTPPHPAQCSLEEVGESLAKNGKRGSENYREFSSLSGLPAALHAELRYNPFTAADEKIPLSVVHVNNKPQYLVFCCTFRASAC